MSERIKELFAIYHRADMERPVRVKIAEGTTEDFAKPIGFVTEDRVIDAPGESHGHDPWEGINGEYPALLSDSISRLEGKMLTLCDATFTNKEQRESFKSILRDNLWNMFNTQMEATTREYNNSIELKEEK